MTRSPRTKSTRAYAAVQTHVLPGLGDAWDEAGPLSRAGDWFLSWPTYGWRADIETFDLIQMISSMERALRPAPVK